MESPLRVARMNLGLSITELAIASGVSPGRVSTAERGAEPICGAILATLGRVGLQTDELVKQHRLYREQRAEQIEARVANRGGQIPAMTRVAAGAASK